MVKLDVTGSLKTHKYHLLVTKFGGRDYTSTGPVFTIYNCHQKNRDLCKSSMSSSILNRATMLQADSCTVD